MFTTGGSVEIWTSHDLLDFYNYEKHVLWVPPPDQPFSADIWAPEFHAIYGRWYAYFAAGDPKHGNKSHRMWVLEGPPSTEPPTSGKWQMAGPIKGMDSRQWAIDGTVITLDNALYFVYSGWPVDRPGCENQQELWIIRLDMPTQASSAPVRICQPHKNWECSGSSGINEGPQWLESPDGNWKAIVYSCAGSWTKEYKMNVLQYMGGDPLDPRSWRKGRPLLQNSRDGKGPFGPGHGTFVNYRGETVAVFHATDNASDGWANRKARVQRVRWTANGPDMGGVVGTLVDEKERWLIPHQS
ncbi:Arabinanase/levansucrase/invertase [Pseudovirgaria hyperparasitica]|uniref:Arabinanase/levansucrase/invertase n=1 Tax=Pseudovirgaria hyperparasitica TaxID=470096 RepID=A0A6A6WHT2_9PEZI|nr:Arabinanase/levansucrase/invertase [Pseudovirgaria hyperparasitica]KAF2762362.1 Arabinanase/levansucrase/invertase [Pseudovirgaria hyperparasitica]